LFNGVRVIGVTLQEFGLLMMAILSGVAGQFLLKTGALRLGKVTVENAIQLLLNIVTIPELVAGLVCYGIGAVAYILVLTRVNLSVAGPAVALSYVFSVLIGYFLFQEPIPMIRLTGLGFIVAGVVLVVWQK
jgi:drug/metabolite transporter (DMT)-like permease